MHNAGCLREGGKRIKALTMQADYSINIYGMAQSAPQTTQYGVKGSKGRGRQ